MDAVMVLLKKSVNPIMVQWLGGHWGKLAFNILYAFYYIACFPMLLKIIGKHETEKTAAQ